MGFSIKDTKTGWKCDLPEAQCSPKSGSGGKIFLFQGNVQRMAEVAEGDENTENMDYLANKPWPSHIVMKQIRRNDTHRNDVLGEVVLTKFLGDRDVGPPCTIMPCDSQRIPIFTATDANGEIYLFMNRMSDDLFDRYVKVENEYRPPNTPRIEDSIFYSLEESLGTRMENVLNAGLLFTDIKLDNVLFVDTTYQERVNQDLDRKIYDGERDEYFLVDFDLMFACHLFSRRIPFEVALDDANIASFIIPGAVQDQSHGDTLHLYPRDCESVHDNPIARKAYLTIMKGMVGIMYLHLPIFDDETKALKHLLSNLTIGDRDRGNSAVFSPEPLTRQKAIESHLQTQERSWLMDYYGPFSKRIPWYAYQFKPFRTKRPPWSKNEAMHRLFDPPFPPHGGGETSAKRARRE